MKSDGAGRKAQPVRPSANAAPETDRSTTAVFDIGKDKNRLLLACSSADLARLEPLMEPVTLLPGEVLAYPGQKVDFVYFPQSAVIAVQSSSRDVGFVETGTIGREGALGLMAASGSGVSLGRAMVQIAGRAMRVRADAFRDVIETSAALQNLRTRYGEAVMAMMMQSLACKTLHSVEERLCRWLLTCRDRTGSDTIPLTQEALAETLGVQRTTVTAAARVLQAQGLISYRRGVIACTDVDGLRRSTCECYGIVRGVFERLLPYTYVDPPEPRDGARLP